MYFGGTGTRHKALHGCGFHACDNIKHGIWVDAAGVVVFFWGRAGRVVSHYAPTDAAVERVKKALNDPEILRSSRADPDYKPTIVSVLKYGAISERPSLVLLEVDSILSDLFSAWPVQCFYLVRYLE